MCTFVCTLILYMEIPKVQKTPIKYSVQLTEEQKLVKASVYEKDVNFVMGEFGTGKTLVACLIALDFLFKKDNNIDKIIITRPIDFNATGYLKGTIEDKMALHIMPIKQNLYNAYNKEKIDKLFQEGVIQILPIDYMKGMTFLNAITIVDEFEDITYDDFSLILTRLGKGSKLIFTGSEEQIDKKMINTSCIHRIKCLKHSDLVGFHTLTINHRNENIAKILDYIKKQS